MKRLTCLERIYHSNPHARSTPMHPWMAKVEPSMKAKEERQQIKTRSKTIANINPEILMHGGILYMK